MIDKDKLSIEADDEFINAAEIEGARRVVVDGQTRGISPKVYWPTAVLVVVGVVVLVAGYDEVGLALLGAALAPLGVGAVAGPGKVQER